MISWNVNGLRACIGKGFLEYFKEIDADIFCIQESKLQEGQIKLDLEGYHQYWNYAEKKGYSGTAIFTNHMCLLFSTCGYDSLIDIFIRQDFYTIVLYDSNKFKYFFPPFCFSIFVFT